MDRRAFLFSGSLAVAATLAGCGRTEPTVSSAATAATTVRPAGAVPQSVRTVEHTDAEWRHLLNKQQYAVLRESATESPFTSALLEEHRAGRFSCAGCDLDLFSSKTKFDSGTGWPSFWDRLPGAVGKTRDTTFGMARTAVHCNRCEGHLGHVFDDGPHPTGLRYCINGVALRFKPGAH